MQRKHHPSTPFQRHGQVGWRDRPSPHRIPGDAAARDGLPSCVIIVAREKGWGSTGVKETIHPTSFHADYALSQLSPERYQRYKISVYLKDNGASQARRAIRKQTKGW